MTDEEREEFREDIQELCEKYGTEAAVLIVLIADNSVQLCGNGCPVCINDALNELIATGKLKHDSDQVSH